MELLIGTLIGVIILVFLVAVHEFGHAYAALKNGVGVDEFGIGFPPRAWGKKLKSGMLFSLNWLPLGGFVKLQGEYDAANNKGDYGAASFFQKTQILLAGVAVNWIIAAIILTILALFGLPKALPNQFFVQSDSTIVKSPVQAVAVTSDSPAEAAGVEPGDELLSIKGEEITSPEQLSEKTEEYKGQNVDIVYKRGGNKHTVQAQLNKESTPTSGYLGVAPGQSELIKATWSAPVTGMVTTAQFSWLTLVGVKDLAVKTAVGFSDKLVNTVKVVILHKDPDENRQAEADQKLAEASASVAGPIGILAVIFPAAAQAGITNLLFLTAIISLTLAVMNILPIPALDGGRWATMAVFRLLKKPLTKEREETIQSIGFVVLMVLIVIVTFVDIGKLF